MVLTEGERSGDGAAAPPRRRRRQPAARRARSFVLLRQIPTDSVVHRLWAGTKLLSIAAVGITLSFRPQWGPIGLAGILLVAGSLVARIPVRAVPRFPAWFWITVAVGLLLTLISGGAPQVDVGGAHLGLGGVEASARFLVLGLVLLGLSALVGWTTPLGEIAPALGKLGAPLRIVRLPVDEWAVVVALCVRCLPLLAAELRILLAVRRLRSPGSKLGWRSLATWRVEPIDLLTAVLAVALRRAGELGEAIEVRGGTGLVSARRDGPRRRDAVVLVVVAAVVGASFAVT